MHSDDVHDGGKHQEEEHRHVQHMPQREHALINGERRCLADGGQGIVQDATGLLPCAHHCRWRANRPWWPAVR